MNNKKTFYIIIGVIFWGIVIYVMFFKNHDYSNDQSAQKYYTCLNDAKNTQEKSYCTREYGSAAYYACNQLAKKTKDHDKRENNIKRCENFLK